MVRFIIKLLMIILIALVQVSFLPNFFFLGGIINLSLILVTYWVLKEKFQDALPKIILLGFFIDLFAFYPIGLNILSLAIVAYAIDSFAKRFLVAHNIWRISSMLFLVAAGTLLNSLVLFSLAEMMRKINKETIDSALYFFNPRLAADVFLNVLFFLILYLPLKKFDRIIDIYSAKKIIAK